MNRLFIGSLATLLSAPFFGSAGNLDRATILESTIEAQGWKIPKLIKRSPSVSPGSTKLTCEPGQPGAEGKMGPQGEQGLQGLPGAEGKMGPKGEQGLQGLPGAEGKMGPKGEQGLQGLPGAEGKMGPKGEQGLQGLPGAEGKMGPKGEQGLQGLPGAEGKMGPKGEQGLRGAEGKKGPAGPKGATKQEAYAFLHMSSAEWIGRDGFSKESPTFGLYEWRSPSKDLESIVTSSGNPWTLHTGNHRNPESVTGIEVPFDGVYRICLAIAPGVIAGVPSDAIGEMEYAVVVSRTDDLVQTTTSPSGPVPVTANIEKSSFKVLARRMIDDGFNHVIAPLKAGDIIRVIDVTVVQYKDSGNVVYERPKKGIRYNAALARPNAITLDSSQAVTHATISIEYLGTPS